MQKYTVPNIIPVNKVMNATINSLAMPLEDVFAFNIQIVFTGTPTGSFKLQGSADPVANPSQVLQPNGVPVFAPTNWSDITNSTFFVVAAGNVYWNVYDVGYNYVRVVYTDTSGGTSTAIITVSSFVGSVI